jgi:hypothetical protein
MVEFRAEGRLSLRAPSVSEFHFTPSGRTLIKMMMMMMMMIVDKRGAILFYVWPNHGRL